MRVAVLVLMFVGVNVLRGDDALQKPKPKGADEPRLGTIIGELKSQTDTNDKKNTIIEVLAPGEEKPRKYHVLYDPEIKGPIAAVLKDVRAAKVGDRVEFEWVQTGHGPAIKTFRVLKKGDASGKKDQPDKGK
jgi:hypothetical protein